MRGWRWTRSAHARSSPPSSQTLFFSPVFLSPFSGPIRYDCVDGRWVYARDGHCLMDKLREELAGLTDGGGPAI
jgi:hypothetical protein